MALLACVFAPSEPVRAQQEPAVIDRILAVVDEDPILLSEVEQAIGLGLVERQAEESEEEYRRRVLARLIEQRLRFHEIDTSVLASCRSTRWSARLRR